MMSSKIPKYGEGREAITESYWQIGCNEGRAKIPPLLSKIAIGLSYTDNMKRNGYQNGWLWGRAQQFREEESNGQDNQAKSAG